MKYLLPLIVVIGPMSPGISGSNRTLTGDTASPIHRISDDCEDKPAHQRACCDKNHSRREIERERSDCDNKNEHEQNAIDKCKAFPEIVQTRFHGRRS